MWNSKEQQSEVWKGVAAGAVGGLVASWTMNQFQRGLSKASEAIEQRKQQSNGDSQPTSAEQEHSQSEQQRSQSESEDSTMHTAGWIAKGVFHRDTSKETRKKLGPVVHYSFGTLVGALYGAVSEKVPLSRAGEGTLFGTAVYAGADDLMLWALHLAGPPTQYPLSAHARALASHLVYGVTTETVRSTIRHVW